MSNVRAFVREMYPNETWRERVDKMPDDQVYAIYERNNKEVIEAKETEPPSESFEQFALFQEE